MPLIHQLKTTRLSEYFAGRVHDSALRADIHVPHTYDGDLETQQYFRRHSAGETACKDCIAGIDLVLYWLRYEQGKYRHENRHVEELERTTPLEEKMPVLLDILKGWRITPGITEQEFLAAATEAMSEYKTFCYDAESTRGNGRGRAAYYEEYLTQTMPEFFDLIRRRWLEPAIRELNAALAGETQIRNKLEGERDLAECVSEMLTTLEKIHRDQDKKTLLDGGR